MTELSKKRRRMIIKRDTEPETERKGYHGKSKD
jgi:hypothetical protein